MKLLSAGLIGKYNPEKGTFHQLLSTSAFRASQEVLRGRKRAERIEMVEQDLDALPGVSLEDTVEARDELQDFVRKVAERRPSWVKDYDAEDFPPVYARSIRNELVNNVPSSEAMAVIVRRRRMGGWR